LVIGDDESKDGTGGNGCCPPVKLGRWVVIRGDGYGLCSACKLAVIGPDCDEDCEAEVKFAIISGVQLSVAP
jgi:hypothetical protein